MQCSRFPLASLAVGLGCQKKKKIFFSETQVGRTQKENLHKKKELRQKGKKRDKQVEGSILLGSDVI